MDIKSAHYDAKLLNEYKKAIDESSIVSKANSKGIITFVNSKFCEVSGYEEEELLGKSHNIIRHPSMTKDFFQELWKTISNKKIFKGVIINRKKDGNPYYVDTTIVPILDDKDEIIEFIAIRHDITKIYEQERVIEEQFIDEFTQLPNRQKLLKDIKESKATKVALININRFRDINNFYGFETGDLILKKFTQFLLQRITLDLTLYRVTNDIFAIFANSKDLADILKESCNKILKDIIQTPILIDNNSFYLTLTIGVASSFLDNQSKNNPLSNAEYASRIARKHDIPLLFLDENVELYDKLKANKKLIEELKNALITNNLLVFGQKIVNNITGEEKYETLMRIRLSDGTILSPFKFLNEAKKAKLYLSMTRILVRKACEYFQNKGINFNINLTLEDLKDKYTMDFIFNTILKTNTANFVTFEIVESEGIENFEEVESFIKKVKQLGCKIAIDDFGTGYSNFEYIIKLNVDYLKIDGSLIKNIYNDNNIYLTVKTINNFAKALNIETVAEFVHNKEVLDTVKSLGIDFSQGFYLDEPKELI